MKSNGYLYNICRDILINLSYRTVIHYVAKNYSVTNIFVNSASYKSVFASHIIRFNIEINLFVSAPKLLLSIESYDIHKESFCKEKIISIILTKYNHE